MRDTKSIFSFDLMTKEIYQNEQTQRNAATRKVSGSYSVMPTTPMLGDVWLTQKLPNKLIPGCNR